MIETERLVLRKWRPEDADSLYEYAKDPEVGPPAGWPPHKGIEESRGIIEQVFQGEECYAICEKNADKAIGAIELKLNGNSDLVHSDEECELGFWLGKPFWGLGYVPEASETLIKRGFEELGMKRIWCAYYDGNEKSRHVQEKLNFVHHSTCKDVPVPLLNEIRTCHNNILTKERWEEIKK